MGFSESHHSRFVAHPANEAMLSIDQGMAALLRHTPLYAVDGQGVARVIKAAGVRLSPEQIAQWDREVIPHLVAKHKDMAVAEIQNAMLDELLVNMVETGDVEMAKSAMVLLVEQAFADPKMAHLQDLCGVTLNALDCFSDHPDMLNAFMLVSGKGYLLAEHSVNVMAAAMIFALHSMGSRDEQAELCLAAILHDVGRLELPDHLTMPSGRLSDEDFALVCQHPGLGRQKLKDKGFSPKILQGIEEHHERMDGSGYPIGTRQVSVLGQILGLADSFDALTGYASDKKGILKPMDALRLLKEETDQGKFDRFFFTSFAYSLAS